MPRVSSSVMFAVSTEGSANDETASARRVDVGRMNRMMRGVKGREVRWGAMKVSKPVGETD